MSPQFAAINVSAIEQPNSHMLQGETRPDGTAANASRETQERDACYIRLRSVIFILTSACYPWRNRSTIRKYEIDKRKNDHAYDHRRAGFFGIRNCRDCRPRLSSLQ